MSEITPNEWSQLKAFTPARIALGRSGISQPTGASLGFQLDHARARDAVHEPVDFAALQQFLQLAGVAVERVHSAAPDRRTYLQRPDLGRQLTEADWSRLRQQAQPEQAPDIAIVVGDGLSSQAVMAHAEPLLALLLPALRAHWRLAPVCLATQARVALGDDVGEALKARLVLMLIGERPGLSAADSLGLYLTWAPMRGRVDSARNCISNIRPAGLAFAAAAETCLYLVSMAFQRQLSGVLLKDESTTLESAHQTTIPFLSRL